MRRILLIFIISMIFLFCLSGCSVSENSEEFSAQSTEGWSERATQPCGEAQDLEAPTVEDGEYVDYTSTANFAPHEEFAHLGIMNSYYALKDALLMPDYELDEFLNDYRYDMIGVYTREDAQAMIDTLETVPFPYLEGAELINFSANERSAEFAYYYKGRVCTYDLLKDKNESANRIESMKAEKELEEMSAENVDELYSLPRYRSVDGEYFHGIEDGYYFSVYTYRTDEKEVQEICDVEFGDIREIGRKYFPEAVLRFDSAEEYHRIFDKVINDTDEDLNRYLKEKGFDQCGITDREKLMEAIARLRMTLSAVPMIEGTELREIVVYPGREKMVSVHETTDGQRIELTVITGDLFYEKGMRLNEWEFCPREQIGSDRYERLYRLNAEGEEAVVFDASDDGLFCRFRCSGMNENSALKMIESMKWKI